jgi:hypothetical protein
MTNGWGRHVKRKGLSHGRVPKARAKRVLWTSTELKLLKKLPGKAGVRRIARQLKRSEAAMRFKAWEKRIKLAVKRS